jgi:hypothetical protein
MNLNDLLHNKGFDLEKVLVLRHKPPESDLAQRLPWLAAERPTLFNAYQQTQGRNLEKAMAIMAGSGHIASFIGHESGKAVFIGLYSIDQAQPLTREQYMNKPEYIELKNYGLCDFIKGDRDSILWFDLNLSDFYTSWKGKLIIEWPSPERSWWRYAHRNEMPVHSILEDSALNPKICDWKDVLLKWEELRILPSNLKSALSQWRGIYYVFDISDRKGYVGSAYGDMNILGRWCAYAARRHGGNTLLRGRDPSNFLFSILQIVSPDMSQEEIVQIENSWKERLHTRMPYGLNNN